MKRIIFYLVACISIVAFMTSCEKEDEFDQALLYGKWVSGTVYYKYISNGTGTTWDTSEDVNEEDGQPFTWTLVQADLTHIHIMTVGGNVPKYYKVTELTASTLKYEDDFGVSYSFIKVTQ
ncbi:MAG: hypothetical protein JW783_13865 [Bacteroidales bacterium]|nr:hypothetical protein [Bacteroidales bacterium]MBN2750420.1 hypothetical protein [Bacteroidales bacterium]